MSAGFRAVQWNAYKIGYDIVVAALVASYLTLFIFLAPLLWPQANPVNPQIQWMRALGSCAFLMLTVILSIGPLTRLDTRFLPLLYNRRHLGVMTSLVALAHAWSVLDWYHSHGKIDPFLSLLDSSARYLSFQGFPFEILGALALTLLAVMAAISHDFWLAFLTPPRWKTIHMLIYPAYGLLVLHVALGAMQGQAGATLPILLALSFGAVAGLHILAGFRENPMDKGQPLRDGWLDVGKPESIPDGAARIVGPESGERIAVFRNGNRLSALSNVCAHQNGPLGEGRIIDGCVTCPWHGFQYRLEDGCAPPPFTEKLNTFRLRLTDGIVQVNPDPLPPGTFVEPLDLGDRP